MKNESHVYKAKSLHNHNLPENLPKRKVVALKRQVLPLLYSSADFFITKNRLLKERIQNDNEPLRDYWLSLDIAIYHRETDRLLSVYEFCDQQLNHRVIARHLFFNQNLSFPLRLKDNPPIAQWQEKEAERYGINWEELLSMGEAKLRTTRKYRFSECFD